MIKKDILIQRNVGSVLFQTNRILTGKNLNKNLGTLIVSYDSSNEHDTPLPSLHFQKST